MVHLMHWSRNVFPVPSGKAGKGFVNELAKLYRAYAEGTTLECIALKAASVLPILLLQRPHCDSKAKDHVACLSRRLDDWKSGDIKGLLHEGRTIQKRLPKNRSNYGSEHSAKAFSNLMLLGKTKAALRLLSEQDRGKVLQLDTHIPSSDPELQTVHDILKSKHPTRQPVASDALLYPLTDPPEVHPVIFDNIDGNTICAAALHTNGAAGPSAIDARGWRRLCTSFHIASRELCHALALLAKRISTKCVDPQGIAPLLACRLIALDKNPGVRPIGICEVPRRIIAKAVLSVIKDDIQDAAGCKQLCAGQLAGIEAAIHTMHQSFSSPDTEAVMLVDASNAFNSLNRQVALHNIRHLCPPLSTILINTYRNTSDLFVDGSILYSEEGITQGDPLAMPMYAIAILPLIDRIDHAVKQIWYADDASATGRITDLRMWWDKLVSIGPSYGYYVNASKTWLVVKEDHLDVAKSTFHDTRVNITSDEGRPLLGSGIGTRAFIDRYVDNKVEHWCEELKRLSSFAKLHPHAAYSAFTHGFISKWLFLSRTTPNIKDHLQPLEDTIQTEFIPALTGKPVPGHHERELFALPTRLGGLGLINPTKQSDLEYTASINISCPLLDLIMSDESAYSLEVMGKQYQAIKEVKKLKHQYQSTSASTFKPCLSDHLQRAIELA